MGSNRIYDTQGDDELEALYNALIGRQPFQYRAQDDPLYRSYADRYVQNGRLAMRDTIGSAAALTGGYGSSYTQGVGQQEYELYLQRLGQVMPQLYKAAWERYSAEGDELRGLFDTTMDLARDELGREKDRYDMASQLEQQAYLREQDRLDREMALDQMQYQRAQTNYANALAREKLNDQRSEKSYQKMVSLISQSGYSPSDAELSAAGMSRGQADALRSSYLLKNPAAMLMSGGLGGITFPSALTGASGGVSLPAANTGGSTGSGSKTTAGSKEQLKLAANRKGGSSGGKTRRF